MKVAVVGAGSTYTPELVSGLAGLPVDALAIRAPERSNRRDDLRTETAP